MADGSPPAPWPAASAAAASANHGHALVHPVSSAGTAPATETDIVRACMETAMAACEAETAALGLLTGDLLVFQRRYADGHWRGSTFFFPPPNHFAARVLASGLPYRSDDLATEPFTDRAADASNGLRTQLTVPLTGPDGVVLGVLTLWNKRHTEPFTDEDTARALTCASQAALAVHRLRTMPAAGGVPATGDGRHAREPEPRLPLHRLPSAMAVLDGHGVVRAVGPALRALLGDPADCLLGRPWEQWVHPNDQEVLRQVLATVTAGRPEAWVIHRVRHTDGDWHILEAHLTSLLADPAVGGIVLTARDATERQRATTPIAQREATFRLLFRGNPHPMWVCDRETLAFMEVNEAAVVHYGYSREEFLAMGLPDIRPAEEVPRLLARLRERASVHTTYQTRHRRKDGSIIDVEVTANLLEFAGRPAMLGVAFDVTARRQMEAQLAYQASHDGLTRLHNRQHFVDGLARRCAAGPRAPESFAVLFLDLDGFKLVNDSHGHDAGDALLVAVAERLSAHLRPGDLVARFGGDEFAVLLEGTTVPSEALQVALRLAGALSGPFRLGRRAPEMVVTTSIGIALGTPGAATPEDVLRKADIALYQAKAAGKDRVVIYDGSMEAPVRERLALETDLRRALERGELVLHYQPEVDLGTGELVGMEALVRWQHPTRGLLPPSAFIPVAEETGLIVPLGQWVLAEACRQAAAWAQRCGPRPPLVMSVNVAARQLAQRDLAEQVAEVLGRTRLSPASLRMEITESAVMADMGLAIANLAACKALGVEVALDDFGTGYSSLSHLQRFPLDVVKVDQSFVQRLGMEKGAMAIVRAVTATARALGLGVVAEGIETMEQARRLQSLRCHRGQGYLFGRPAPADRVASLIRVPRPLSTDRRAA